MEEIRPLISGEIAFEGHDPYTIMLLRPGEGGHMTTQTYPSLYLMQFAMIDQIDVFSIGKALGFKHTDEEIPVEKILRTHSKLLRLLAERATQAAQHYEEAADKQGELEADAKAKTADALMRIAQRSK